MAALVWSPARRRHCSERHTSGEHRVLCAWQDVYIMQSMTVLVLVCIWHAVIPQIAADWGLAVAHTADLVVLCVLGLVFVAMHVAFVLWIRARVRIEHVPFGLV